MRSLDYCWSRLGSSNIHSSKVTVVSYCLYRHREVSGLLFPVAGIVRSFDDWLSMIGASTLSYSKVSMVTHLLVVSYCL